MKTLVVYYSRTGTTKKVGERIAEKLGADIEEIKDTINRMGVKGYLISGRDAMKKRLTKLEAVKFNPAEYDLVVVGTPIWSWNLSVPIRTYISEQKDNFKDKVAFFCTMGGSGDKKAFSEMENIIGKKPEATLALKTVEVARSHFFKKVKEFCEKIESPIYK